MDPSSYLTQLFDAQLQPPLRTWLTARVRVELEYSASILDSSRGVPRPQKIFFRSQETFFFSAETTVGGHCGDSRARYSLEFPSELPLFL